MTKATILIVDDRPENLLTLESLLEAPDLDIVRAESGNDALARTLDHDFALVLLDVQMPGMDGYETAELMRMNKKTKHIPIIFVTAEQTEREHMFRGYDSGAVDYLFKPLEPAVLTSKVGIFLELYRQRHELKEKTRELDAKIVELEEMKQQLEESNAKLQVLSSIDGLTGLRNRRSFDEFLDEEWQRSVRYQTPLSLILADIDHFKAYNDCYGHIAGDKCLQGVSKGLADSLQRTIDVVARYGGEEFAVVLPNTDSEGAALVAQRMMDVMETLAIEHCQSSTCGHVTISMGVCTVIPTSEMKSIQLIESADLALYESKTAGRNRYTAKDLS